MPRLLVEKGPDRGKTLTVTGHTPVVVGRDQAADLQLSDIMSSRRHFMIGCKGAVFGLKDLESANGTLVNGRKADGPMRLNYGDSIQVGETLLSWLADEQQAKAGGLIGHVIGGYKIEERLGRGAMGTVYKAIQLSLGRVVALKVLSPDLTRDAKFCEMFIKEARAAGALNHPNIIQVYDVGEDNGNYYFSMEFAGKGSVLDQLNKQKRIELPRAVTIIKDTCRALDYAEKKGLVHRDIKPDNLMVNEDDSIKLGDLGLAMSAQELQGEQAGVFGTPHYIAPEQAMGKPIDHRADLYALGASFYRILSGQTLFSGASVKEILKKQVRDPHPPITTYMPDCPTGIITIIDKMLAKNPNERYQHGADILQDLENWENLIAKRGGFNSAAFAAPIESRRNHAEQTLAIAQNRKGIAIAALAAVGGVLVLLLALWLFVFNKGGAAISNTNTEQNTSTNTNIANTPPSNDGRKPGIDKEVADQNTVVDQAIGQARLLYDEREGKPNGTAEQLNRGKELLEKVIKENPKSTRLPQAQALLERIKAELSKRGGEEESAGAAWEEARRGYLQQLDEFQFNAADMTLRKFVEDERWSNSKNPRVMEIWDDATREWNALSQRIFAIVDGVDNGVRNAMSEAERLGDKNRAIQHIENALAKPRAFVAKTDDETQRKRIEGAIAVAEERITAYREDIRRDTESRLNEAWRQCDNGVRNVLIFAADEVRRGNFTQADALVDNFDKGNKPLNEYRTDPKFAEFLTLLKLRKLQTRLQAEAIRLIASSPGGGVFPGITTQQTLLRTKPLPRDAETLFGSKSNPIQIFLGRNIGGSNDGLWQLKILNDKLQFVDWLCTDFGPGGTRKPQGMASAFTHIITNDGVALARLLQPANTSNREDPAALVGLWAWFADLGAGYEAFALVEKAYGQYGVKTAPPPAGNVAERLTWEYMGFALLTMIDGETKNKNYEKADEYRKRFNSDEFKGCRARKGK